MKTRIVALFLSLAILLSLCSFAIAEEPTQLTICIGRRPYDSTTGCRKWKRPAP